jgi:hypothetical protein
MLSLGTMILTYRNIYRFLSDIIDVTVYDKYYKIILPRFYKYCRSVCTQMSLKPYSVQVFHDLLDQISRSEKVRVRKG